MIPMPPTGAPPACDFPGLAATHAAALATLSLKDVKAHAIELS